MLQTSETVTQSQRVRQQTQTLYAYLSLFVAVASCPKLSKSLRLSCFPLSPSIAQVPQTFDFGGLKKTGCKRKKKSLRKEADDGGGGFDDPGDNVICTYVVLRISGDNQAHQSASQRQNRSVKLQLCFQEWPKVILHRVLVQSLVP